MAKKDPQAQTVGSWPCCPRWFTTLNAFPRVKATTSCLDVLTQKGNDGQVGNLSTRATGYILCVEKTGSEFVLPILSPRLPKNGR